VIARALVLSEKTVKTHVSSILAKLGSDAPAAGDNLHAFTGERISDGEADALACSSDDGDIARKLKALANTVHCYPTQAEAFQRIALQHARPQRVAVAR
jgi:hypothetical protein